MFQKESVFYLHLFVCVFLILIVKSDEPVSEQNEKLFKQLFKLRRVEQLEAVKKIKQLPDEKQNKMVQTVTKTIFDVILKSRVILESSGFTPGVSDFPETEAVRDALSLILENTALMGEMVLRLPERVEPVLRSTAEWPVLLAWSLVFANQTQLLDTSTTTLIYLVGQELNLTNRDPDYINPYKYAKEKVKVKTVGEKEKIKKKKKTETPRGPRITLPQTGEL
uniref:Coiled-coil domain-containing protein 134 n=2 Tax=Graphocephala atropunctata TaxID=36148 RepID=A0A1B6KIA2_9HEMI